MATKELHGGELPLELLVPKLNVLEKKEKTKNGHKFVNAWR